MTQRHPTAKARIIGADLRNPTRYPESNLPPLNPVGDPPAWMNDEQREAWNGFLEEIPWLTGADRALLEVASILRARFFADPDIGVNALQVLSAVLSKLGATPVDQSRVRWSDEPDTDEFFDDVRKAN